ncbi:hypothetical protein [uncultured Polaribacter sp.]|uniref:hypothetical protein n=1 Tax=uncultured Polaribacter sp. TaxID=174711 RepID=UPI00260B55C8|nr:hypothetical protein [uncultured Polaribacter sp.]
MFIILIVFSTISFGQKSFLNDTKAKDSVWYLPDYAKIQFAGNIGLLSVGVGYEIIHRAWYSEFLYGYVPESVSEAEKIHLITIKNTFPICTKEMGTNFTLSPIVGFTASLETGNNSFLKVPEKYPKGYYITNAIHFTLFTGVSIHKKFPNSKMIKGADFYFELGTVETYLWYAITSKEVKLNDIFSTAIGVNLYF